MAKTRQHYYLDDIVVYKNIIGKFWLLSLIKTENDLSGFRMATEEETWHYWSK